MIALEEERIRVAKQKFSQESISYKKKAIRKFWSAIFCTYRMVFGYLIFMSSGKKFFFCLSYLHSVQYFLTIQSYLNKYTQRWEVFFLLSKFFTIGTKCPTFVFEFISLKTLRSTKKLITKNLNHFKHHFFVTHKVLEIKIARY